MCSGEDHMKTIAALALALVTTAALANPALHGTWSAASVQGRPLKVEFAADKTGKINGQPMRWDTLGGALFIRRDESEGRPRYGKLKGERVRRPREGGGPV
jgi:hypothetical protein